MIEFGTKVTDSVTGFQGVVVANAQYDNGCEKCLVTAKSINNASPVEEWIDEQRLTTQSTATAGGPMNLPPGG